jgi:uncharacterized protein
MPVWLHVDGAGGFAMPAGATMSAAALVFFSMLVASTAFLAGVFGMAGGMILMGGLLFLVSVPDAMILHGITQMTSNGWRAGLWRHYVNWSIVAHYCVGLIGACIVFSALQLVPDERIIFLVIGIVPFLSRTLPDRMVPQVGQRGGAELCGFICTALQLLSGVSGPMLDVFFVRSGFDRRVIVATKAACQIITHLAKLVYFGFLVGEATEHAFDPVILLAAISMAILGTTLSRTVLERLSNLHFQRYTWWLVMTIGAVYLVRGVMGYL